ncbi:MAG: tetratricopeptide repeat protein [Proteobacteria bacterium]|nr:tetratricopeptide repeat protein [Pseudomonadota bacterium]
MRSIWRYLVLSLCLALATAAPAFADDRADAKAHYQAGVKAYGSQDYRTAIREFAAAQQLLPAELNNYNLALCYDKLGEAEPAIQYYRQYLDHVPTTDKRPEIEASMSRLQAAASSSSAKRAEEARRAEEQRRADEAAKAEAARKADDTRRADEAAKEAVGPVGPAVGPTLPPTVTVGVGSTGTPGTASVVSTGDAQLDRANAIDVNGVRAQRFGAGTNGVPDPRGGPAVAAPTTAAQGPNGALTPDAKEEPPKATPVYKKWWFWAVVAVSAYVVYEIVNNDSTMTTARARETLPLGPVGQQAGGGMTLLRW